MDGVMVQVCNKSQENIDKSLTKRSPVKSVMLAIVKKFRRTGSVLCQRKGASGRRRTVFTNNNQGCVLSQSIRSPKRSLQRTAYKLNISETSTRRLFKSIAGYSYRIQIGERLNVSDKRARETKVTFTLTVISIDKQLDSLDLNAQMSLKRNHSTVNELSFGMLCLGMGSLVLILLRTRTSIQLLLTKSVTERTLLHLLIISRGTDFEYPSHSSDLTPPDAYIWGMRKESVFQSEDPPANIGELRRKITLFSNCSNHSINMLDNLQNRYEACLRRKGAHFEYLN
ncbi:hypothetical protein ILUMI_09232 [Ignelater luminosus]|uniref:Uncharacterized protein n=1 Tax=Ignelater luminosus TaxID=2038154 RepID=A0A8K0GG72_IGNLU|nr:hypothetical protein ILUMI_09232 [Ignelater luminosus]